MEGKAIYAALMAVQRDLKAPKSNRNSFGKYNYRSAEDILEAVKPLLNDNGLVLLLNDSIEQVGDRYYVKATAKLIDVATGDSIENAAFAREPVDKKGADQSQVTGASSSYARKYAMNGLFAIDAREKIGRAKMADAKTFESDYDAIAAQMKKEIDEVIAGGEDA